MSSGITENDSLFVAYTPAWHKLGTVVDHALTSDEALTTAGLNWKVESKPVFLESGKKIEKVYANVRSDTEESLGIVTERYKILQNSDAFRFMDELVGNENTPCKYESAGSLYGGKRVWMMARLPDQKILDDLICSYIFVSNSHDGKSSVKIGVSNVRICCNNTLQMAISDAPRMWTARHMSSIEGRQKEAAETLKFSSNYLEKFNKKAEEYSQIRSDVSVFLDKLFVVNEKATDRIRRNVEQSREEVLRIHNSKDDLGNFRNTAWGIYNAVADFVSNSEPIRKTETFETKRFISYLDGNDMLLKAQMILEG
jgi:phage/plasmid-like protein (TIGR03299 family)